VDRPEKPGHDSQGMPGASLPAVSCALRGVGATVPANFPFQISNSRALTRPAFSRPIALLSSSFEEAQSSSSFVRVNINDINKNYQ
jgi:hypothetical protein